MSKGSLYTITDRYRPTPFYLVLLLILLVIAYWPISFHVFSLKNDALNYFLPVRRLVSESYAQGILPLWTPYLNLGYPLHGDMQSGVWNPFVQLFSLFGTYSHYTLQLETLLYIYLGGAGLFFLLKHFAIHPLANLLAAVAYMLCGFNSDSCQFLNWIAGTAFLPFVFLFYYRCLQEHSLVQGLYAGTALFFLFTCAYPADFIITCYVLAALLLVKLARTRREKETLISKKFFLAHAGLLAVFLVLSAPAILSYLQSLPLQERGTGTNYEEVMSNALHPALLSSFTTPLGIWKMPGVSLTDPLERNSYIGLGGFILLLSALSWKSSHALVQFSKWAVLVFLLFSLGELGGIRVLSYYLLPLMDTFRHPANARMFTLFFCCILVAYRFHSLLQHPSQPGKLRWAWGLAAAMALLLLLVSLFTATGAFSSGLFSAFFRTGNGEAIGTGLKSRLEQLRFADLVLLNTLLQLPFFYFFYRYLIKKPDYRLFTFVAILNSVLFTMLFQPFTVVKKTRASDTQEKINRLAVKGYPIPDISVSLKELSRDNEKYMGEIGCLNLYNKKPGRSEYRITPSNLLLQNKFWFDTAFRNRIMEYPLLYRADFVAGAAQKDDAAKNQQWKWAIIDSVNETIDFSAQPPAAIRLTRFEPNRIEGTIHTPADASFVLLQNYYPRWKLAIDGKPQPISIANTSFIRFQVPGGEHRFAFYYEARDLRIAFYSSLFTLLAIAVLALTGTWKPQQVGNPSSP